MNRLLFRTNNGGSLGVGQAQPDGVVFVSRIGEENNIDGLQIAPGDFVQLINYYRYIKSNDIHDDFINPSGKNTEV